MTISQTKLIIRAIDKSAVKSTTRPAYFANITVSELLRLRVLSGGKFLPAKSQLEFNGLGAMYDLARDAVEKGFSGGQTDFFRATGAVARK
jgi:hypothetical protein